jgi:hypothetical protein
MPTFNGKYSPDDYLDLELLVDQKFACWCWVNDRPVGNPKRKVWWI